MTVRSTRKENGVKPMEIDRVEVMITNSVAATRAKVERTKVAAVVTAKSCPLEPLKAGPQGSVVGVAGSWA